MISPNIILSQFWTENIAYKEYTRKLNSTYCDLQNYKYVVEEDGEKIKTRIQNRSITWYKPILLLEILETQNPDYVLFLDADAVVVGQDQRIEKFIDPSFDIVVTEDHGPSRMNAGVILIKNTPWVKDFLSKWWEISESLKGPNGEPEGYYHTGLWHDQTCFGYLYDHITESKEKIKIVPNHILNSRVVDDPSHKIFIFHAFAYGNLLKRNLDLAYYKIFNLTPPKSGGLLGMASFYNTDKHYEHKYFELIYDQIFQPHQESCKSFLEIGCAGGESLRLWRDYFENAEIVGIDINTDYTKLMLGDDNYERLTLVNLDQSQEQELIRFCEDYKEFDFILDDGSHKMYDQQISLAKLFKILKPGGLFVLEDLHTSLEVVMPEKQIFNWGDPTKTITLSMLEKFQQTGKIQSDFISSEDTDYLNSWIESIEIYRTRPDWSITAIIKKKIQPDLLKLSSDDFNINSILPKVGNSIHDSDGIKTIVVYHTYLVNQWKIQVAEQLKRLHDSGLYDAADKICVTAILAESTKEEALEFFSAFPKLELELSELNYGEYLAIKKVRELAFKHQKAKILFFHTKGVFNNWTTFEGKEKSEEKIRNSKAWRYCLEHFTIDRWQECVKLLDDWDNVGVSCNGGWYWGNFWWSSFKHISKTKEPIHSSRWENENWLNSGISNVKNFEFYHMGFNPFLTEIKEEFYKGDLEKYKGQRIIVKSALWGSCPYEIDEGYSGSKLGITQDVTELVQFLIDQNGGCKLSFGVNLDVLKSDPVHGTRKCLVIEIFPEKNPDFIIKLGHTEGQPLDFSF